MRSATSGSRRPEHPSSTTATRKSRSPEGWFNLGDVGYLDEEGYLYLTDRQSFTIISGGVNIYPQETEDVLVLHPAVADVAVFGVPNADLGEEVKAVVQLLDPERAGPEMEAELLTFCASDWPPSSARARSTSTPRCPGKTPASSTSGS